MGEKGLKGMFNYVQPVDQETLEEASLYYITRKIRKQTFKDGTWDWDEADIGFSLYTPYRMFNIGLPFDEEKELFNFDFAKYREDSR